MMTGCRPVEIIEATWDQFDLDKRVWSKPARNRNKRTGHEVALAAPVVMLLQARRKTAPVDCDLVFPGRKTRKGGWKQIERYSYAWDKIAKAAKLEPDKHGHVARPYDLRHSFASMAATEFGLFITQRLLGHKNAATTGRYAHGEQDALRATADKVVKRMIGAGKGGKRAKGGKVVKLQPRRRAQR